MAKTVRDILIYLVFAGFAYTGAVHLQETLTAKKVAVIETHMIYIHDFMKRLEKKLDKIQ